MSKRQFIAEANEVLRRSQENENRLFDEAIRFNKRRRRAVQSEIRKQISEKNYGEVFRLAEPVDEPAPEAK